MPEVTPSHATIGSLLTFNNINENNQMKNNIFRIRTAGRQWAKCFIVLACIVLDIPMVSAQQISNVNQINTVRQKISPVKVSDTELRNIKSTSLKANTLTSQPSSKSLPGAVPIEVSSPGNNDIWEAGKEYVIKWGPSKINEDVRIDLVSKLSVGGKPLSQYNIVGQAPNTGSYTFRVPYNWLTNPYGYCVKVNSISGGQNGYSNGPAAVYTQSVDLECRIVDEFLREEETGNDYMCTLTKGYFGFNLLMRNKGINSPVTIENVLVRIIKEPEGVVLLQEEWGYSGIYGHDWYKLPEPRKFLISIAVEANHSSAKVSMDKGAYRVEVEVDPQNRLGENQQTRSDNKDVKRWVVK